jgi:hypothetical protein
MIPFNSWYLIAKLTQRHVFLIVLASLHILLFFLCLPNIFVVRAFLLLQIAHYRLGPLQQSNSPLKGLAASAQCEKMLEWAFLVDVQF